MGEVETHEKTRESNGWCLHPAPQLSGVPDFARAEVRPRATV